MASAPRSGRGGRPFESDHPDTFIQIVSAQHFAGLFCIPTQALSEPDPTTGFSLDLFLSRLASTYHTPSAEFSGSKSAFSSPNSPSAACSKALPGSNLSFLSLQALPNLLSGSKSPISIPFAPLNPLRTAFPGSNLGFLSPNNPPAPRSRAIPGSNLGFLSPHALPNSLSGSKSPISIPFAPLNPLRTAFPGSNLGFLSPHALSNGLPGSDLAFPSPNSPSGACSKALPGSKPAFLSPQALSGAACRSGAGARSTQCYRGQRQAASSPALRLRLSLHKVRLRRPLRPLLRHQAAAERKGEACEMASRSARVWGGAPVWIAARTREPCALRTGAALLATLLSLCQHLCQRIASLGLRGSVKFTCNIAFCQLIDN